MGLLRNVKDTYVDPVTGKLFRASDPEVHLRYLNGFAQGHGLDLTNTNTRNIINKNLHVSPTGPNYEDGEHEDGEIRSWFSVSSEGRHPIAYVSRDHPILKNMDRTTRADVIAELAHREPTRVHWDEDSRSVNMGLDQKLHLGPNWESNPELTELHKLVNSRQGTQGQGMYSDIANSMPNYELSHIKAGSKAIDTYHKSLDNLNSLKRRVNHARNINKDTLDITNDILEKPDQKVIDYNMRDHPSLLSGQFMSVNLYIPGSTMSDKYGYVRDQLDLDTGTWAKMHPDGYFPD